MLIFAVMSLVVFLIRFQGHVTSECKANRVFDTSGLPDMSADDAWNALVEADQDRDLDELRIVGN